MSLARAIRDRTRNFRRRFQDPKKFVKTDELSGQTQFELLKLDGCKPTSSVLEHGCGCLHMGVPLMQYLGSGQYAGIDPNAWLRTKAMKNPPTGQLVKEKQPRFLTRQDFDARELGMKFDFIYSHSVLSHAAHKQLDQYIANSAAVLNPDGHILSSIRLADGNAFGSVGNPDGGDSMDEHWVYPGVSWFTMQTVEQFAAKHGLKAERKPQYTEFLTSKKPNEFHDWVVLTWQDSGT
jgi:cyclopropane fatty-acyl-phospholipid synthase-like methyltransferase